MENFYNQISDIVSALPTFKNIIILGKGGSLNDVNKSALDNAFIININDSERFYPGHIALFHSPWVYQSVRENGFKAQCYITSLDIAYTGKWLRVNYLPESYDSIERTMALFNDESLYLTDFLLITAIKITNIIANKLNRKLDVYLLGFDFEISKQNSIADFSGHDDDFKNIFLRTQRNHFEYLKRNIELNDSNIFLYHVGSQKFSQLSVFDFNYKFHNSATKEKNTEEFDNLTGYYELISRVKNGYVLVVAELTNNHVGDAARLRSMIQLAKSAGADMIKVQKRDVEVFYTNEELESPYLSPFGKTLGDYRKGVELDDVLMDVLCDECKKQKIVWFASVLDYPSLQYMIRYNPPIIKLPSTISNHKNYLKKVAVEFQRDLVISTGLTDKSYEAFVLDNFNDSRNVFLLQTVSSYPAPPESCQIAVVRHYDYLRNSKYPNLLPGYSSHDVGSMACVMAVAAGAVMIEKHVKLGDLEWVHFDGVAVDLQTDAFAKFISDIRKAQVICGSGEKKIQSVEFHKYKPNQTHN